MAYSIRYFVNIQYDFISAGEIICLFPEGMPVKIELFKPLLLAPLLLTDYIISRYY